MSTTPPPPPPPPSHPPPGGFGAADGPPDASVGRGPASHGQVGPGGRTLPSPWKRIVARFLDWLIVGLIFGVLISAIVLGGDTDGGVGGIGADASSAQLYLIGVLGAAVGFVWDAVCTKRFGGSPMKLAFGMRVVQAESGDPVRWSNAIIRWAVPGAIALVPLAAIGALVNFAIVIVSLVFLFTKPLRRAVWDFAAKTVVVDK